MAPVIVEREHVHWIVGGFYAVYNYFGFGLVEPVYAGAWGPVELSGSAPV